MKNSLHTIIQQRSEELFAKVKTYREHMHRFPELSYAEHETMTYVVKQLTALNIPFTANVAETGITAIIRGDHHSETDSCFGLRSELDALPIQELNEVPYCSTKEGIMHACGHDVHTAILLGAAELLFELRNELPHPVKLFFQPGEEKNPGGASLMIADGALKNPDVHAMTALHVFPEMETGKLGFKTGLYMASCDEIYITINGKGGHGATPHQTIDPIMIGAQLLVGLQQIVSRNCDPKIPCVLSFGHFEALGATNVIPEKAHLKGTFRTMDEAWRAKAWELIESHVQHVCAQFGATADLTISKGYPFLENDPELTMAVRTIAETHFGEENIETLPIRLTSEDFSYYAQEIPVCFFRLGVRNEAKGIVHGVHHPRFNIDDRALVVGVQAMTLAPFS
ncbi:MAG: N-acyl-L-amino acid amidohydrolase [Candidatus Fluviicola riflensis]|nr:MAG: N-acyl-L-amino acid amidohydrolase [Candidatus Fluviicola riflensis]OGS77402.1 MAG: N-acyl-L-amino acid amidohydrolase [Candidatus Fluviicola riflensis]OGS83982.1 MAG: N-acyl-L-amino acid amidohydrolase [Fluviicola sp. RIFCSPHIGHO2_12_FULL_43_24]OGS84469.1 MAG: N-acyl-L-amino acid amidohydrolase [Fluviicola sp. RIFCSPHIGHO2_01_FULL_43_53]